MRLGKCPACGKEGRLVVHHIIYEGPEYTVELCETCHQKAHAQVRKYHDNWFEEAFSIDEWLKLLGLDQINRRGLVEAIIEKADEEHDAIIKKLIKKVESRFRFFIQVNFAGNRAGRNKFYKKLRGLEVAGLKYKRIEKWLVVKTLAEAVLILRTAAMCGGGVKIWLSAPLRPSDLSNCFSPF